MADYRRHLTISEQRNILSKYKNHRDVEGGIFVPSKRRKLLGVKAESRKGIHEDTADFWSDVRKYVRHALTDLQLISEVAHPEQLKEIFQLVPFGVREKDQSKASLADVLETLFKYTTQYKKIASGWIPVRPQEHIIWKAHLASEIVQKCLQFYKDSGMITSKAHERLVEEVIDMVGTELSHVISREMKLPYYAKS
ncbi:MAG: hypothetical protein AUH25_01660 [Thaumarchaeota archaeon 13_1_40CM_38_12]|nr:MAG: hypothetical protein AUH25_01660 [Thaumarchaeota archaeon 13_1_40CM_38_12]OLC33613.1 MAG: hypothetical protein AUH84_06815 [Thaumarchaeota archaeon 13_1_40CM_4_38_7]OLC92661.1 MAG: hypothetical protein AUI92_04665 [Thaumarchaeota archaeon 13_1_40CM_3_38_6]OLD30274.1 MAG: hypothetical protein AUI62_01690 [Thaumarchaeota archaeon 13_1_40CM_2_39_7]